MGFGAAPGLREMVLGDSMGCQARGRAFATRCLSPQGLHELRHAALSLRRRNYKNMGEVVS